MAKEKKEASAPGVESAALPSQQVFAFMITGANPDHLDADTIEKYFAKAHEISCAFSVFEAKQAQ